MYNICQYIYVFSIFCTNKRLTIKHISNEVIKQTHKICPETTKVMQGASDVDRTVKRWRSDDTSRRLRL